MLDRQTLLILISGLCIVNGIFSPYLNIAMPLTFALLPELFPKTPEWVLFFSSIFVASATVLFSGVPAALYERLVDRGGGGLVPMYIWLGAAIILTLPALSIVSQL